MANESDFNGVHAVQYTYNPTWYSNYVEGSSKKTAYFEIMYKDNHSASFWYPEGGGGLSDTYENIFSAAYDRRNEPDDPSTGKIGGPNTPWGTPTTTSCAWVLGNFVEFGGSQQVAGKLRIKAYQYKYLEGLTEDDANTEKYLSDIVNDRITISILDGWIGGGYRFPDTTSHPIPIDAEKKYGWPQVYNVEMEKNYETPFKIKIIASNKLEDFQNPATHDFNHTMASLKEMISKYEIYSMYCPCRYVDYSTHVWGDFKDLPTNQTMGWEFLWAVSSDNPKPISQLTGNNFRRQNFAHPEYPGKVSDTPKYAGIGSYLTVSPFKDFSASPFPMIFLSNSPESGEFPHPAGIPARDGWGDHGGLNYTFKIDEEMAKNLKQKGDVSKGIFPTVTVYLCAFILPPEGVYPNNSPIYLNPHFIAEFPVKIYYVEEDPNAPPEYIPPDAPDYIPVDKDNTVFRSKGKGGPFERCVKIGRE